VLRHDKVLSKVSQVSAMRAVPEYLLPSSVIPKAEEKRKSQKKRGHGKRAAQARGEGATDGAGADAKRRRPAIGKAGRASASADPLQSFKAPKRG
jgi:hypothetical protein